MLLRNATCSVEKPRPSSSPRIPLHPLPPEPEKRERQLDRSPACSYISHRSLRKGRSRAALPASRDALILTSQSYSTEQGWERGEEGRRGRKPDTIPI